MAAINNAKLLDVGCEIVGPCRMLASEFNCKTTGLDLSEEFIKKATGLSKLVGLNNKTNFIHGVQLIYLLRTIHLMLFGLNMCK